MATRADIRGHRAQPAPPAEVRQLRAWTAAEERYCERSLPAAFAAQTARTPGSLALSGDGVATTYEELDRASNRVAAGILAEGGTAVEPIGVLLRELEPFVIALLGVMKAGKVALPLDPRFPEPAVDRLIRASGAPLVIRGIRAYDDCSTAPIELEIAPGAGALLLYTSGSTGDPKGLCRSHRAALHHSLTTVAVIGEQPRVGMPLSPAFGTFYGPAFAALLSGGTLLRYDPEERGLVGFPEWLVRHRVEVTDLVPSMLGPLVSSTGSAGLPSLDVLLVGSERLTRANGEAARRLLRPGARLVHTFGSTEALRICMNVIEGPIDEGEGVLPVGLAMPGQSVELCAPDGSPAPPGTPGEIVVTSRYLAHYWRPELDRSGAPPPEEETAARVLRTGDQGMIDPSGLLVLVGRKDRMVKIRGQRVELEAVERALLALEPVEEAIVLDEPGARSGRRLVAFLILRDPQRPDATAELRRALRSTLPPFMVPSRLVVLDTLPLLPNGKLDLRGIAAAAATTDGDEPAPAIGETEELLGEMWASALELEAVGREEDFFELGGDSLAAAVVAAQLHDACGVEVELRAFVESPTVARMAALVDRLRSHAGDAEDPPLVRVSRAQPLPLSFAQERTWRNARTSEASAAYVMTRASHIRGPLDVAALRASLDRIFARHEVLRTTFEERQGRPVQVVHPPAPVDLPVIDLSAVSDPEAQASELLIQEGRTPFDLERGSLLRLRLVRIGAEEHQLLRIYHHIVSDGWSWSVFFDELRVLYEAYRRDEPPPLPADIPVQYGDFAVWERRRLHPGAERYHEQVVAWRRAVQPAPPPMRLPFVRAAPRDDASTSDGVIRWGLAPEVSRGLNGLAREVGATRFMVRLAAFAAQLAIDTNQDDIVLGTYVTNRRRAELQAMFGFFSNLTTLRLRFAPDLTLRKWIARVRAEVIDTSARAEIPYEQLCEELRSDGIVPPEIRVIFGMTDQLPPMQFGGLEVTPGRPVFPVMPWGFSFSFDRWHEDDSCLACFDARIHAGAGVSAFVARFQRLVGQASAHPDRPLGEMHHHA